MLLTSSGFVKLCDFGVSRRMPNRPIFEHIGTPAYLAPEIIEGKGYSGFEADIWSLGIMTYIALTGKVPFKGDKIEELQNSITTKAIELSNDNELSEKMKEAIVGMLEKKPKKRMKLEDIARVLGLDIDCYEESK